MIFFNASTLRRSAIRTAIAAAAFAMLAVPAGSVMAQGAGAAAGGTAVCSVKLLGSMLGAGGVGTTVTAGQVASINTPPGVVSQDIGARLGLSYILAGQNVNTAIKTSEVNTDFMSCMTRAIGRAVLQQMTVSIVNWINTGFKGTPSFIQNYEQFFTQVADNAVGNFLAGSDLAFLCSPFKLQIKIAVAQSYARRGSSQQCSISKIVNNLDRFMTNFSEGGWRGFLSFTTTPTNNPYGAYMDTQSRLNNSLSRSQNQVTLDLSLGRGFLSSQEERECYNTATPPPASPNRTVKQVGKVGDTGPSSEYRVCKLVTTTPGSTIANQLDTTLGTNFRQLELAQSFDQILSALINQLVQKTLYGGLSNLSKSSEFNQNPGDLAGTALAFAKSLEDMATAAGHVRTISLENINDIESSQQKVAALTACWNAFATSTTLTTEQLQRAKANATSSRMMGNNLDTTKTQYVQQISRINYQIAVIEDYRSSALSAFSLQELQKLMYEFHATSTLNNFMGSNTVPYAEQDRAQLTASLATIDQDTAKKLEECHAFPPTS